MAEINDNGTNLKHQQKIPEKEKIKKILSCSMCLKIVDTPRTLMCYHSFCQSCLKKLPKIINKDGVIGVACLICKCFSDDANIKSNLLLNELLNMYYIAEKGENDLCEQCTKKKSVCQCVECKMSICEECKVTHSRVPLTKHHHFLDLATARDVFTIDRVIFCPFHDDEPVKLNCVIDQKPLCIKCKVTEHENHKTETVETALERLMPSLRKDFSVVSDKVEILDNTHDNITQKITDIKEVYCKCRLEADEFLNELISRAKEHHKALSDELLSKEEEEIAKLQILKEDVENKLKEYRSTLGWIDFSCEVAKGTSLLFEVENGLNSRVGELATINYQIYAATDYPSLEPNTLQLEMEHMTGKVKYEKVVTVSSNNICSNSKHVNFALSEFLPSKFNVKHNITLTSPCYRIAFINGDIWAPIPGNNSIEVYDKDGKHLRSIILEGRQPRSVSQLQNGEVVFAGANGLFILDNEEKVSITITTGAFSDLDVYNDGIFALRTDGHYLHFEKNENTWQQIKMSPLVKGPNGFGTLIQLKNHFFVGSSANNSIQKYNQLAQFLGELGYHTSQTLNQNYPGNLFAPFVCSVDEYGSILVADCNNQRVQLYVADTEWKVICSSNVTPTLGSPYDCKCDSNGGLLWVTNSSKKLICFG